MQKENKVPTETYQYVGPYRLEKTLGKGQTGEFIQRTSFKLLMNGFELFIVCQIWLIPSHNHLEWTNVLHPLIPQLPR